MLLRSWWCGLALIAVHGCSRSLDVPPEPEVPPGAVFGRVVVAVPGSAERQPAKGATVALLGSSLALTTGDDGRFALTDIEQATGKLLFRYVEGTRVRQKLLSLSDLGAGPGRQLSLGDVLVVENATVRGRAVRAEAKDVRSGHRGTVVFVPEGPYLTYTADDGSFELDQLPEGSIEIGFFRSGYQAQVLAALAVRGGELLTLRDVLLELETSTAPGSIAGSVRFVPAVSDATGTTVTAGGRAATVTADGELSITMLPAGLYSVSASRAGYTGAVAYNVLVNPGEVTRMSPLTLGMGPGFDAGMPPPTPDGGEPPPDAGPPDAGPPDAGPPDSGFATCTSTVQCGVGRWCDNGFCVPLCTAGSCTAGRYCDPMTFTCVHPCSPGCDAGLACDVTANACRALCDGSRPCPRGSVCNLATAACEPECLTSLTCPAFTTCSGGACVPNGACALDTDCPADRMCIGGVCDLRPTAASDAGVFPCSVACDCRLDETCRADGVCVSVPPPTLFFYPGADGGGRYPSTPSGNLQLLAASARRPDVIALLWDAGTVISGTLALDGGVTLAGGYVDCGPTRWTRDDGRRTPLGSTATRLLSLSGSTVLPREDITLRNLELESHTSAATTAATLEAASVERLSLLNLAVRYLDVGPSGITFSTVACTGCTDLTIDGFTVLPSPDPQSPLDMIQLSSSSGHVTGVKVPPMRFLQPVRVLGSFGNSALLSISGATVGELFTTVADGLFRFDNCGNRPVEVRSSTFKWTTYGDNRHRLIRIQACEAATVAGNVVDGAAQTVSVPNDPSIGAHFLWLENSNALVENNTVILPSTQGMGGAIGFEVRGPQAAVELRNNVVDGGTGLGFAYPLRIQNVNTGSVDVHDNHFDVRGQRAYGLWLEAVFSSAGLRVHDNFVRVTAPTSGVTQALHVNGVIGVIERNQFEAAQGSITNAVFSTGVNTLELYQNLFVAGPAFGIGQATLGIEMQGLGSWWVVGNSIDLRPDLAQPGPSIGLRCGNGIGKQLTSNIFGTRNTGQRWLIAGDGTNYCTQFASYSRNYFWLGAGGVDPGNDIVTSVTGTNGNIFGGNVSPYQPGSFELANGSVCIDNGAAGPLADGGVASLDVFRRPRVVDGGADIGATERQ